MILIRSVFWLVVKILLTEVLKMDYVVANRIVALNRQMAAIRSMVKRGELREEEAELLIKPKQDEIEKIRSQSSLDLSAKRK